MQPPGALFHLRHWLPRQDPSEGTMNIPAVPVAMRAFTATAMADILVLHVSCGVSSAKQAYVNMLACMREGKTADGNV